MGFASNVVFLQRGKKKEKRKKKKKKEPKQTHSITPGAGEKRTVLQRPPLSHPLTPGLSDAYRRTRPRGPARPPLLPPPPARTRRIAESLHRKIQIVSRAVRLLEHKLRRAALLSVSNILSIIHRGGEKIKRCWPGLK